MSGDVRDGLRALLFGIRESGRSLEEMVEESPFAVLV